MDVGHAALSVAAGFAAGAAAFLATAFYASRVKGLPLEAGLLLRGEVREINIWGLFIVLTPHLVGALAAYYTVLALDGPPAAALLLMVLWLAYAAWLYERLKARVNPCLDCPECQRQG